MTESDRAKVMCELAAIEVSMVECKGIDSWWSSLSAENRQWWVEFQAAVRAYQHGVQNRKPSPG